jgi:predicted enzyme related to lactoylglutathione lyase
MSQNVRLVVYPVKDLDAAKTLFTALLGTEPYADSPYYVGYRAGDQEIGLDPHGHTKSAGPIAYWEVPDIKVGVDQLVAAGAEMQQEPKDVGGGKLIALLKDASGNVIGLMEGQPV